jgi:hypothetical protein
MTMKENITNRPDLEEAPQTNLVEEHLHQARSEELTRGARIDETPLPKGIRDKVETVEVSTFKPKR